ncbi:MAG: Uncharacterised protein [Bacteroidia bacterium]|nr:MAG: Uncharacterised protein [Bacteroidia bacterium]
MPFDGFGYTFTPENRLVCSSIFSIASSITVMPKPVAFRIFPLESSPILSQ